MALLWWRSRRAKTTTPPQPWVHVPQQTPASALPQRRYLEDAAYPLPKDEEEHARLEFQHRSLYLTLGNHYLAPLPPTLRVILDVGTGTGIWAVHMTGLYPQSLVLGLDMDTALFNKTPPANCLLREGNVLTGLPLPDGIADFVHQRFLVLAIPDTRWPGVVHELVRVTRFGGWVEMVETDARVQAGGPATTQVFRVAGCGTSGAWLVGRAGLAPGRIIAARGVGGSRNAEYSPQSRRVGRTRRHDDGAGHPRGSSGAQGTLLRARNRPAEL